MAPTTFTVVNDETLVVSIMATTQTLVYVAPGITKPVVEALTERLDSQSDLQCTLILDLDPEVYRLGYGTEEGLIALQALATRHHLELRQQEGIRIGLLITDGQTVLYSPTPLLIEAGSVSVNKPNAVMIAAKGESTAALMQACAANGAASETTPIPQHAEIGQKPATPVEVNASLAALKDIPPKVFDLARIERVYESKIQFVELEVTGYRLSTKKVSVPNDLLVGEDSALKEKLKNSFTLLQGDQMLKVNIPDFDAELKPAKSADGKAKTVIWSEAELEKQRKALYEDFLINVPRFGQIIMRNQRKKFDARIALLRKQIEAFKAAVEKTLGDSIVAAIDELAKTLLPRIRENVPARYSKFLTVNQPTDDDILGMIKCDLEAAFGGVNEVFNPELRCVFKDVTYESIQDKNFKKLLGDAMRKAGGEGIVRQLFSEHDAAPEANGLFPPNTGGAN
jgi:mannose/fructose/N-acetylgalactosamine-specific phosphotransferase system component IIB